MEMVQKRMDARGQGGFTLIELLVVIAILAILAGVVVFAVGQSTANAEKASCDTERAAVITAIAAAETSNKIAGNNETPADYLDANSTAKFIAVSGGTSGPWSPVQASGSPLSATCA